MENCVAPGLDEFDVLLEVVLSLVRVVFWLLSMGSICEPGWSKTYKITDASRKDSDQPTRYMRNLISLRWGIHG